MPGRVRGAATGAAGRAPRPDSGGSDGRGLQGLGMACMWADEREG